MNRRTASLLAGATAGLVSLAGTAWAAGLQVGYNRLLVELGNPLVPVPAALLPAGAPAQPPRPALSATQRAALATALWRNPLDQRLGNFAYVDQAVSGRAGTRIERQARLLAATGWRYTPAQQNLLMRAALDGRFADAVDRAEGLLRRQRLTAIAIAMMGTMEAIGETRPLIVARLRRNPGWRPAYLAAVSPQIDPRILDARIATTAELLRGRGGLSRAEFAPFLDTLVGTGRQREAYRLWRIRAGTHDGILYDPRFVHAAAQGGSAQAPFPFEWSVGQDIGHSTQLSADGATITWDGRGAPTFLSQRVPVQPNRAYLLTMKVRSDTGSPAAALAPMFLCGDAREVRFSLLGEAGGVARYRSDPVDPACDTGVLQIAGRVDGAAGGRTITIGEAALAAAD